MENLNLQKIRSDSSSLGPCGYESTPKSVRFNSFLTTSRQKTQSHSSLSPNVSKADKLLFNSKFSNLPTGAAVILPSDHKKKEALSYFTHDTFTDYGINRKRKYDPIQKSSTLSQIDVISATTKRSLYSFDHHRSLMKRGTMHIGELLTKKQIKMVVKNAELDRLHEQTKELAREALPLRMKRLEDAYAKRLGLDSVAKNLNEIFDEFHSSGINAPTLMSHRRGDTTQVQTLNTIIKTDESISIIDLRSKTERTLKTLNSIDLQNDFGTPTHTEEGYNISLGSTSAAKLKLRKRVRTERSPKSGLSNLGCTWTEAVASIEDLDYKQKTMLDTIMEPIQSSEKLFSVGSLLFDSTKKNSNAKENITIRDPIISSKIDLINEIAKEATNTKNKGKLALSERKNGRIYVPAAAKSSRLKSIDAGSNATINKHIDDFLESKKHFKVPTASGSVDRQKLLITPRKPNPHKNIAKLKF